MTFHSFCVGEGKRGSSGEEEGWTAAGKGRGKGRKLGFSLGNGEEGGGGEGVNMCVGGRAHQQNYPGV